ncbi:MAG TPA: HU family DNA-binding protein [Draconibacterium sp.]|nr:HU family DNA-binding protein [Draconibacterium sp.]
MAVKFKVIEKGQPGVPEGGVKKFYASTQSSGEMTLGKLTKSIEMMSTVSGADIRAVLYALVEVIKMSLADGQIVRLAELGSLRISLASIGEDSAEDVTSRSVKGARTVFAPGTELKEMLKNLKYQKVF